MGLVSDSVSWKKLVEHYEEMENIEIKALFDQDQKRFSHFSIDAAGLFLDYSKNLITDETFELLTGLVREINLPLAIKRMFKGEAINSTEHRAVLHTALRDPKNDEVRSVLNRMFDCADELRSGKWKDSSGKAITDVVNIGIGGSDLGPKMVINALLSYVTSSIKFHFVSNVDDSNIFEILKNLDPETTLFIVSSKTFTTQETLCNANTAKKWLRQKVDLKKHLLAVTAKPERAVEFGVDENNIYPFWDWVGGRFSLWSAIGLCIVIAIGQENFKELLSGAHRMDEHFYSSSFDKNMPVILALIGIWNINFLGANTQAILPYAHYLSLFPTYLQQLEMESNGKHITIDGDIVDYNTAPIIWGSEETNGQHSFHQLLMQGTHTVPVDFILPVNSQNPIDDHHLFLFANCLAQSQALMEGKDRSEIIKELADEGMNIFVAKKLSFHKAVVGSKPSNTILFNKLTPSTLGSLIALYEHKVFVQGFIWGINSFDQWGVELGKKLTKNIVPVLQKIKDKNEQNLDSSTVGLIGYYLDNV